MKNNIKIFFAMSILCGALTFIGSILGNALNQTTLFIGAFTGGIIGIVLSALLLTRFKIIEKKKNISVVSWGIIFFITASLFATTNLNTPIIPVFCLSFAGFGAIVGNSFDMEKGKRKEFYHALFGYLFILPTLYFVIGSIAKYNLGFINSFTLLDNLQNNHSVTPIFNLVSPAILIGGPLICLLLNVSIKSYSKQSVLKLIVDAFRVQKINRQIAITSSFLLVILSVYLFLENI